MGSDEEPDLMFLAMVQLKKSKSEEKGKYG